MFVLAASGCPNDGERRGEAGMTHAGAMTEVISEMTPREQAQTAAHESWRYAGHDHDGCRVNCWLGLDGRIG